MGCIHDSAGERAKRAGSDSIPGLVPGLGLFLCLFPVCRFFWFLLLSLYNRPIIISPTLPLRVEPGTLVGGADLGKWSSQSPPATLGDLRSSKVVGSQVSSPTPPLFWPLYVRIVFGAPRQGISPDDRDYRKGPYQTKRLKYSTHIDDASPYSGDSGT